ncbi:hypothetical protein, partial [Halomonas cibimaris]|uniref:hypothetical protein n=1 Tax=Halomonas cibimaris TaxID=657012 RepID=UPI003CD0BCD1
MTDPESVSAIAHRHRCSWGNIQEPWIPQVLRLLLEFRVLKDQHLDTAVSPHRLDLYVEAERGSLYPCPECG